MGQCQRTMVASNDHCRARVTGCLDRFLLWDLATEMTRQVKRSLRRSLATELAGKVKKLLRSGHVIDVPWIWSAEGVVVANYLKRRCMSNCINLGTISKGHTSSYISVTEQPEQMQGRQPGPQLHSWRGPRFRQLWALPLQSLFGVDIIHGKQFCKLNPFSLNANSYPP